MFKVVEVAYLSYTSNAIYDTGCITDLDFKMRTSYMFYLVFHVLYTL